MVYLCSSWNATLKSLVVRWDRLWSQVTSSARDFSWKAYKNNPKAKFIYFSELVKPKRIFLSLQ